MKLNTHEREYRWNKKKKGTKVHIKYGSGAWCQIENTGLRLNMLGRDVPEGRKVCICCIGLEERGKVPVKKGHFRQKRVDNRWREPDLATLMGERMR